MKATSWIPLAMLLCVVALRARGAESAGSGRQRAERLTRQRTIHMDYLLYLPKDYEKKEAWPLLLFLHGAGERGNDLELVKRHGPPKLIEAGREFPFLVVSPQCPANRWWDTGALTMLLDELIARYRVDQDRIYVTGLSMGGYGTWSLASQTPERFAAIVPICGGGERYWARSMKQLPVWVFHGAKDAVVPLERSQEMVEALKKQGGNVKLTVYTDAGHDAWTETYNNPQLYEWLLEQKRPAGRGK